MSTADTRPTYTRQEAARMMAGRFAGRVRDIAPAGLGRWLPAWELVAGPTDDVLDAIHAWEAAGDDPLNEAELRQAVSDAVAVALDAWREAAEAWQIVAGRPGTPKANERLHEGAAR